MAREFPLAVVVRAVDRVTAPMRRINDRIDKSFAPLRRMQRSVGRLTEAAGVPQLADQFGVVAARARGVRDQVQGIFKAIGIATGAATGLAYVFKSQFVDTAAEFERLGVMLESIEGSTEGARKAMDWITRFAEETPLEINDVTNSFIKLRTFGLDPTDGSMRALVDQMALMGGKAEYLDGVILAIGQAWTKQKLQGEEALQLIERGVPVWDLLSQRYGVNAATLQKLSSAGKLGRRVIRDLIEEIGKRAAGASLNLSRTWDGMMSTLADKWMIWRKMVMDAGVFDFLKEELSALMARVEAMASSGELQKLAERFAGQLIVALQAIKRFVIEDVPRIWAGMKELAASIKAVVDFFGGWANIIKIVLAVQVVKLAWAVGGLVVALNMLTGGALLTLGKVLWAAVIPAVKALGIALLTTPVGWVVAAIAAIAGAAYLIYENWGAITEWWSDLWDGFGEILTGNLDRLKQELKNFIGWAAEIFLPLKLALRGAHNVASWAGMFDGAQSDASTTTVGASRGLAPAQASMWRSQAQVTVDFNNVPPGTRISEGPRNTTPLDLSLGYSNLLGVN